MPQFLRYAFRRLRRTPGFSSAAVLCLGLGIGANTALFNVVNAVLLRPLPFAQPDRLVGAWESNAYRGSERNSVSPGIAGATLLTGLLSTLLYDVSATDALVFVGMALVLLIVGAAASYLPARRATRVDPMVALRSE